MLLTTHLWQQNLDLASKISILEGFYLPLEANKSIFGLPNFLTMDEKVSC